MDLNTKLFRNPFLNFMVEFREEVKNKNLRQQQIISEAGKRWRNMTEEQKQPYVEIAYDAQIIEKIAAMKRKRIKKSFIPRKRKSVSYCSSKTSRSSMSSLHSSD